MELLLVILAAIAPVAVALFYINRKDSAQPEPKKWLAKAFFYGVISAGLSFVFSLPTSWLFGAEIDSDVNPSLFSAIADAFLLASIPEELAKLIMLWLLLRKNPFFDERFDGIVYAVCIGMGFAGIENVMYLAEGMEDGSWIGTGIVRALFSIPGHFLFAVLMGYYYSLYHFHVKRNLKTMCLILIAPVIAHGIFDAILMSMGVNEWFAAVGMIGFLFFFHHLKKKGNERIENLRNT